MKVIVTGGRDFRTPEAVDSVLSAMHAENPFTFLATGGCTTNATSVDMLAESWAWRTGVPLARFPANWERHGKSAGPRRNGQMLHVVQPYLVIAFPGGAGTADCVRQARALGIPVNEVLP